MHEPVARADVREFLFVILRHLQVLILHHQDVKNVRSRARGCHVNLRLTHGKLHGELLKLAELPGDHLGDLRRARRHTEGVRALRRCKRHRLTHQHHLLKRRERCLRIRILRCRREHCFCGASRALFGFSRRGCLGNLRGLLDGVLVRLLDALSVQNLANF